MNNYYFTFGTAKHFPFGINDYVLVTADNQFAAENKFREVHPDAHENLINCAFIYSEREWGNNKMQQKYYNGKEPVEILAA